MVVARQCWSKGVREFAESAARVSQQLKTARFLLVGPPDPKSPEAVPDEFLQQQLGPAFQWITFSSHIREILHRSDIVVLPSYYREGVPIVLLEALAMGKPIITTDNVGCRETVEDGVNGLLVPVKDVAALTSAIATLAKDRDLRDRFGRQSRIIAERDFDQRAVIRGVLSMWDLPGIPT
jgi:glycosyltransferase involved in cell wall biosynthesis